MTKIETIALFAAGLLAIPAAFAQAPAYPTKPVKLVVPFSPGGASDLTARTLAQKMGESMGQSIVVENKPGANGVLGIDSVAKSQPDGYTILLTDRGSLTVNPSLYVKLPYDPIKDFSYIGIATDGPYVLVANPTLNVKTVQELVALSKSKPGTVNYSSFGVGSMAQLNLEAFNQKMGTDMLHVPYKGAAPAAQAVGGRRSRRDDRRRARRARLHQGRSAARTRGGLGKALRGVARRADDDGSRSQQRHPPADLLRVACSREHACAHRGQAQRGTEEGARRSRGGGETRRCRTRAGGWHAGSNGGEYQAGRAALRRPREEDRHQAGITLRRRRDVHRRLLDECRRDDGTASTRPERGDDDETS